MTKHVDTSLAQQLLELSSKELRNLIGDFSDDQCAELLWDWHFWRRPSQAEPPGDWDVWMILAGRGFGKTRTGAEWVRECICGETPMAGGRFGRIALVGADAADVRDVMVKGPSGILSVHPKSFRPDYSPSNRELIWPNGAIAKLYSAEDPESLRGPEHEMAWCDETAKWRYQQETFDQIQFGLRIGDRPKMLHTTTPKPTKLIRNLARDKRTHVTRGSTYANRSNLSARFFDALLHRYEGTRLGRQEIDAELLTENPNALWSHKLIDKHRVRTKPEELKRIVVAVDPPATTGDDADECGIVAVGEDYDNHFYVLEDASVQGLSPMGWARKAVQCYYNNMADTLVAEVNNGGDMVISTIEQVDTAVYAKKVHATRGKVRRAEPVSTLYEKGKAHHVGTFGDLEDQMCEFTIDFDPKKMEYSPDRMDALVWGLTELALDGEAGELRIY